MNTLRYSLLFMVFTFIGISTTYAQEDDGHLSKIAIGLSAGSQGGGLDVSKNVHPNFNIKLGFNYFKLDDFTQTLTFSGESMNTNINVDFTNVELLVEYMPFKSSSFKIVGGLAYLVGNNVQAVGEYADNVTFGEVTLAPADIGTLEIKSEWSQVAPYFGIGVGRAVPKRRVGFGFDIGAYYAGSPKTTITGTRLLEEMRTQQETLETNLSGYSWYPRLTLRLAVRIN
ncbi:hypothetical protein [Flammeovirga sp. OC4]|uniref:hypothetical protein n=1 Tax=Flammeovirga sp. OC4 TaxID=1382345 RepID=UPI0012E08D54|nr:hypothetical protein [Flammeovirga sp. OC4]